MMGPIPPHEPTPKKRDQDRRLERAAPFLLRAAELSLIALTDRCVAHGYTIDSQVALAELVQAIDIAKGEL